MRWRALPIATVLAIAAVIFWGLVTVFGSEGSEEVQLPLVTGADSRDLPRIPLAFPEVSKPMIEALPVPEPSPEPAVVTAAAKKPATTKARPVRIPTDGATGSAFTGQSGDATVGPNNSPSSGGDDSDPVGDLNDDFENPDTFGPDEPEEPEEPEEPDVDDESSDNGGVSSGNTGNNGADGSSESKTDPGTSDNGDDD